MNKQVVLSIYCKHRPGGFTRRLYRAYQAIANSGNQLIYIATEELPVQGNNIHPVIIPVRSREGSPLYWAEFYLRATLAMRKLTRTHKAETHFVFSFFYAAISILAKIGLPVRTVTLIRGDDAFDAQYKSHAGLRSFVHRLLEKVGVKFSEKVLATSLNMQKSIGTRTGYSEKVGVLANDITTMPLPIIPPVPSKTVRIATVSVLNPRKNIHTAILALAELKHLDWEYLVIGPDTSGHDYLAELQQLAEKHDIAQRIHFLGWLDNAEAYLTHCHLFLFPTLMEGSPNALMEAMGYGLPCLTSNIPEVTEVLQDQELHFDPHKPSSLVKKLERFMTDPDYAANIALKTSHDKKRYLFDWDKAIADLLKPGRLLA